MAQNEKLQLNDGVEKVDASMYISLVGSLIYLTNTRPDIVYSMSIVFRYMNEPSKEHYAVVKHILRYIQGIKKKGLHYKKQIEFNLKGFTDSDQAGSHDDRKSTLGHAFSLGSNLILWCSKKQKIVALSLVEAEYIATTEAACEAVWLWRILKDLQTEQVKATEIYYDNVSAIAMTKNLVFHARTKHIELRHHFISELVKEKLN